MKLNLRNPLAFFDLETTGTNIANDRIVEISIVKLLPSGETVVKTQRINPQMPIPLESSLIHGIYDDDVKDAPPFREVAKTFATFLEGCDLAGFNILQFDVPLLVEEFLRVDIDFDVSKKKIVDAQKIFHLMEKRTLAAAYQFYCGKELTGAHSAEVDTLATMEVLIAQVGKYEGQDVLSLKGEKMGKVENDIAALHEITASNMVDLAGRIVRNDAGVEVFNFGKHKGRAVEDIFSTEPSYYDWMMRGDFPQDTKKRLTEIKLRGFNRK